MARQFGIVTYATVAAFKADTLVDQQVGDVVQLEDVLSPGVTHVSRAAGAETPDDVYTVKKTNDATKTFWASSVNELVAGNLNVSYSALPDGIEEEVTVAVAPAVVGVSYEFGVISGKPNGVEIRILEVMAGNIVFIVKNNTGAPLTAGTIILNLYN